MNRYLYIMRDKARPHDVKIGISVDPAARALEIKSSTNGKIKPVVVAKYWLRDAEQIERAIHQRYRAHSITRIGSGKTEWFRMRTTVFVQLRLWCIWAKQRTQEAILACALVFMALWLLSLILNPAK